MSGKAAAAIRPRRTSDTTPQAPATVVVFGFVQGHTFASTVRLFDWIHHLDSVGVKVITNFLGDDIVGFAVGVVAVTEGVVCACLCRERHEGNRKNRELHPREYVLERFVRKETGGIRGEAYSLRL